MVVNILMTLGFVCMKVFTSEEGSLPPGHQQPHHAIVNGLNKEDEFCFDSYIITSAFEFCQNDSLQQ